MDLLAKLIAWLSAHLNDAYLMGLADIIKSKYMIATVLLFPFVWPPLRWLARKYAEATPWTDDDKAVEQLDARVNDIISERMGIPVSTSAEKPE